MELALFSYILTIAARLLDTDESIEEANNEAYNSFKSGSFLAKNNWRISGPAIDKGGVSILFVFLSARIRVTLMESHSLICSYPHTPASSGASDILTALAIVARPSPI